MEVVIDSALFLVGLVLILKGADWLTDGASSVAKKFKVSTMVIGLTIVAFGTSTPEFIVSLLSSIEGDTDIAIGNVVGSNIFNALAIMGITALVRPVKANKNNIRYEVPLSILAALAIWAMANDSFFDGGDYPNMLGRIDGIILLAFFVIFMAYTLSIAKDGVTDSGADNADNVEVVKPMWKSILLIVIGLAGLVLGGDWLVDGASGIAAKLGVSQSVIALTIVSAGTSFPELMTSIVAAKKGDTDMAMGNIVGSNIFNIFMILGVSAVVSPLSMGNITNVDMAVLVFSAVAIWACCTFGKRYHYITRTEGSFMVCCMIAYYVYLVGAEA